MTKDTVKTILNTLMLALARASDEEARKLILQAIREIEPEVTRHGLVGGAR